MVIKFRGSPFTTTVGPRWNCPHNSRPLWSTQTVVMTVVTWMRTIKKYITCCHSDVNKHTVSFISQFTNPPVTAWFSGFPVLLPQQSLGPLGRLDVTRDENKKRWKKEKNPSLFWKSLVFESHIQCRTNDDRFPLSLWEDWFCSSHGVPISVLIGPPHHCVSNTCRYDSYGDGKFSNSLWFVCCSRVWKDKRYECPSESER
jgi:hypothetical protein